VKSRRFTVGLVATMTAVLLGGCPGGAAAADDTSTFEISARGGLLTVRALAASLADVLRVIGERTGIQMNLRGDLTSPVTVRFTDVPIDEMIKRLARGYSVCLLYSSPRPDGLAVLREAWIIAGLPVAAGSTAADPQRRAVWLGEVQRLVARRDAGAAAALARLVAADDDPAVRAQAAIALGRVQDTTAGATLAGALRGDPDAYVRRMAARALGTLHTEEARRGLEAASQDPDAGVRQEATRALMRMRPVLQ